MSIVLAIKTDKSVYIAGDVIKGTVAVHVDKRCEDGSPANDLVLQVLGKVTTRVIPLGDVKNSAGDPQELCFFRYDLPLASYGGMAGPGVHVIPFEAGLPDTLPSTMLECCDHGGAAVLSYHVKAKLDRPGLLRLDVKAETMVTVMALPRLHAESSKQHMLSSSVPSTKVVKNPLGRSIGSITMAIRLDQEAVRPGEKLSFTIVAQNHCSSNVLHMEMKMTQLSTWVAHSRPSEKKREISSMSVPGSELGELAKAVERANSRSRGRASQDAEPSPADVYRRLDSGASSAILSFDLPIPVITRVALPQTRNLSHIAYLDPRDNFMETLDLSGLSGLEGCATLHQQLEVTHALEVRLKTSHGSSCPTWSIPVRVVPILAPEHTVMPQPHPQPQPQPEPQPQPQPAQASSKLLKVIPGAGADMSCTPSAGRSDLSDRQSARMLAGTSASA